MKQSKLYDVLEGLLSDYTILDVDEEWPFGWDLTKDHHDSKRDAQDAQNDTAKRRTSNEAKRKHRPDKKPYNIRKDKRLKDLLEFSTDEKKTRRMLGAISLIVVSGLCKYSLQAPTAKELDLLFSVADVTATEMNIFAGSLPESDLTCYGGSNVRPLAILFSRVLFDALCEDCGIAGWTTKDAGEEKRTQGNQDRYSKSKTKSSVDKHHSRDRLKRFVDCLRELDLLELDCLRDACIGEKEQIGSKEQKDAVEAVKVQEAIATYDNFFSRHAVLDCMQFITYHEMDETKARSEKEADRIYEQTNKLLMQEMRKAVRERNAAQAQSKAQSKSQSITKSSTFPYGAPFNPSGPLAESFGGVVNSSVPFASDEPFPPGFLFNTSPDSVLEQARALLAEGREEEANRLLEKDFESRPHLPGVSAIRNRSQRAYQAVDDYSNAVRANCIEAINRMAKIRGGLLKADVGVDIAECALIALLNGDECYKLNIARCVFPQLGRLLGIPGTEFGLPELSDEDEWDDYIYPGDNGKLAQAIVKEDEVVVYGSEEKGPHLLRSMRLGGAIADFSGCQFNEGLFIRKSHVAAFREMGYSERRARDFAIIVATLQYAVEHEDVSGRRIFSESSVDGGRANQGSIQLATVDAAQVTQDTAQVTQAPTQSSPDDLRLLTMERDEAIKKHKTAERECQKLRHDVAEGNRTREELEEEVKRLKEQLSRQDELIDAYTRIEEGQETASQEEITFPFVTDRNVILYGGFRVFHAELEKLIPGIRVVETASHIDTTTFRNADIIFLQINKTNHSNYWNVCETAKNAGVPYYHLNFANARRCAEEMVKRIRGLK